MGGSGLLKEDAYLKGGDFGGGGIHSFQGNLEERKKKAVS